MHEKRHRHRLFDLRGDKRRLKDEARHRELMATRPDLLVRRFADFSEEEKRELVAKVERWYENGIAAVWSM